MQLNKLQISELLSLLLSIFDDGVVSRSGARYRMISSTFFVYLFLDTAPPSGDITSYTACSFERASRKKNACFDPLVSPRGSDFHNLTISVSLDKN